MRNIFDITMYKSEENTQIINNTMCDMYHRAQAAHPTQFHRVMEGIAKEGRLQRLYTQNIDGIDTQLIPSQIPLPKSEPWPTTIQLHGDLKTMQCLGNPEHRFPFDPALFADKKTMPLCPTCEKQAKDNPRNRGNGYIIRPRVKLYQDIEDDHDENMVAVMNTDLKMNPSAVIVVGTSLHVEAAKQLARKMCLSAHDGGGFTAWINTKPPPKNLPFNFVVEGDCERIAMHVSSWWLKECPTVLDDNQIQDLQQRYQLFIAKSPQAALEQTLTDLDDHSLSGILIQDKYKTRILNVKHNNKAVFLSAGKSQITISNKFQVNKSPIAPPREAPAIFLQVEPLPKCWRIDMSERLSRGDSTSITTKTSRFLNQTLRTSLWRLKPGNWLNDEIINSYFDLVRKSIENQFPNHRILETHAVTAKRDQPFNKLKGLVNSGIYTMYIPVHRQNNHWSFMVVDSKNSKDCLQLTYYDSLHLKVTRELKDWVRGFFGREIRLREAIPNPKQINTDDCGLFVLIGIRCLSTGRPHLTQEEATFICPRFRERVLAELLAEKLDPSESDYQDFKKKELIGEGSHVSQDDNDKDSNDSIQVVSNLPQPQLAISRSVTPRYERDRKSPANIVSAFAEEATILLALKEAVALERMVPRGNQNLADLSFADLWLIIRTEKRALRQRYFHYEFARQFSSKMEPFKISPRRPVSQQTIERAMEIFNLSSRADWDRLSKRGKKMSIWTELVTLFSQKLEHPSVVLCAIAGGTYVLENLNLSDREILLAGVRSKIAKPGNCILARLKAASSLYKAVIFDGLPSKALSIETANENLSFEERISLS